MNIKILILPLQNKLKAISKNDKHFLPSFPRTTAWTQEVRAHGRAKVEQCRSNCRERRRKLKPRRESSGINTNLDSRLRGNDGKNKLLTFLLLCSFVFAIPLAYAADDNALPPPPMSDEYNQNDQVPSSVPKKGEIPEVTITPKPDTKVEEFFVNGKLRYIKITPTVGKPYYLFDSDGDGIVDAFDTGVGKAQINQWLLMEW